MKSIFTLFISFVSLLTFAQETSLDWKGYFSYNHIVDISPAEDELYVATDNAFFTIDKATFEMETFSTVDGLSGKNVSCGYYSENTGVYVLGYETGLLQIFDAATREFTSVVEIENKNTIPGNTKTINHIMEYNGYLYISCDFGISVYDAEYLEFDDTYYIGENGAQIRVRQTAFYEGYLYAATENGIYRAMASNENIIDFEHWELVTEGDWRGIAVSNGDLVGVYSNRLYAYDGTSFQQQATVWNASELKSAEDYTLVTRRDRFYAFSSEYDLDFSVQTSELEDFSNVRLTSAYLEDGLLFLGTERNGLLVFAFGDLESVIKVHPNGPLFNNVFGMKLVLHKLWAVFGEYGSSYNPYSNGGPHSRGISILNSRTEEWNVIPYDSLQQAQSLCNIVYNPNKVREVYIGSFFSGLLRIENEGETIELYDENNSPLEDLIDPEDLDYHEDVRVSAMAFDEDENLWVVSSKVPDAVKVLDAQGNWESYSISEVIPDPFNTDRGVKEMVIAGNGYKFITTANHGLLGFYENNGSELVKLLREGEGNGNLPANDVRAIALDQNNQLWIGTISGLRVLYNVSNFFSTSGVQASNIVIEENGEASELMYQQAINDIFVDGSNNKWIATADSGAFYVSSDGQETIYHFTRDNSPLPSNNVNQIEVSEETGEVYFATDRGLVSFTGRATGGKDDYSEAYAYPNPVRPEYEGNVTLTNLMSGSRVKITDAAGNLVYDAVSQGGTVQWNLTAFDQYKVASGVYLAMVTDDTGDQTEVVKIMVIR